MSAIRRRLCRNDVAGPHPAPRVSGQNRTSVEGTRLAKTIEFVGFGLRRPGAGVHGARDVPVSPRVRGEGRAVRYRVRRSSPGSLRAASNSEATARIEGSRPPPESGRPRDPVVPVSCAACSTAFVCPVLERLGELCGADALPAAQVRDRARDAQRAVHATRAHAGAIHGVGDQAPPGLIQCTMVTQCGVGHSRVQAATRALARPSFNHARAHRGAGFGGRGLLQFGR
jgi:hypothetical protein